MLTIRHPLPEHPEHPGVEQWVELRDVSTLRSGDRKAVDKAIKFGLGEDGRVAFSAADTAQGDEALLTRLIVAWSYTLPLPVADPASLDQLPLDAEDTLLDLLKPYWAKINFRSGKTPSKTGDGSSGSSSGSPATTSPATSPTPSSSTSPGMPGTPLPSGGPPMS